MTCHLWVTKYKGEKMHHCNRFLCTRHPCKSPCLLGLPEALVVESSLVGRPGGVPAGVLLLIRAADLLPRHRSRLEAQRSVVRTLCSGQGQMQRRFNVSSKLLMAAKIQPWLLHHAGFFSIIHQTRNQPSHLSGASGLTVQNLTLQNDTLSEEHEGSNGRRSTHYTSVRTRPILGSLICSSHLCRR